MSAVKLTVEITGKDLSMIGLELNNVRRWLMSRHEGNRLIVTRQDLKAEAWYVEEQTVVEGGDAEEGQDESVTAPRSAAEVAAAISADKPEASAPEEGQEKGLDT